MLFFLYINVKMPTFVGILTIMSRKNFTLNSVEHEKSFITSGPGVACDQCLHFLLEGVCFPNAIKLKQFTRNL